MWYNPGVTSIQMAEAKAKVTSKDLLSRITKRVKKNAWPLNERQRLYIKYRSEGMNKKEAGMKAGYTEEDARQAKPRIEAEIIRRAGADAIERPIMKALRDKGIDDNFIAQGIHDLAGQEVLSVKMEKGKDGKLHKVLFSQKNHKALGKALDLAIAVRGDKAPEEVKLSVMKFLDADDDELDRLIEEGSAKFRK